MSPKPTIKIKLVSAESMRSRSQAYAAVAKALAEIGGCDRYIERATLIDAVRSAGPSMKNLDATISSFCALNGVHAIREHTDGRTEDLITKRMKKTEKEAPVADEAPGLSTESN
jgi:hypothetical protein